MKTNRDRQNILSKIEKTTLATYFSTFQKFKTFGKLELGVAFHTSFRCISLFSIVTMLLLSCKGFQEEEVDIGISVENVETVLVINGKIEKGENAKVQLSYSEDIDALINTPTKYEENAIVTISTSNNEQEFLSYSKKGKYNGSTIVGKVGETYIMTIKVSDETYSATSTMLQTRGYKDAWVVANTGKNDGKGSVGGYSDECVRGRLYDLGRVGFFVCTATPPT